MILNILTTLLNKPH